MKKANNILLYVVGLLVLFFIIALCRSGCTTSTLEDATKAVEEGMSPELKHFRDSLNNIYEEE